jgi:hypothetical protein
MQFSVFILLSALLSLALASPIPVLGLKGAANVVTAAAKMSSKAPKPGPGLPKPVRSQSLPAPPRLFPGAFVNARPVDVKNLPILTDKSGAPKRGATMNHPGILTGKNKDGSWDIAPVSHTPVGPSSDVKKHVNHPDLEGHVHLGNTHIDPKDIKAATGPRAGGKATGCEVLGLCNERLANQPKPVRSQSLPPPKPAP